ncbi:RNA 2'-phosphotransferase [Paraflavitalea sp. CAU 1676]|uniref:RNA 2'-phosphotransferase n=1 Tax=Paraflavitalea sp. CAU 1676 TaxID=3032598 RepID=UPI0023DAA01E|nr:RNA 2'-phosphotransferase [Paraflavitalea sp. CAU 1676]MDF2191052.1 RNA 2'-phosphotransferase [Paraflavitalea sp. CAU 1676]
MNKELARTSKFLSLVLRHRPEAIGLTLQEGGWAFVDELISKINLHGTTLDRSLLQVIVDTNDKKRFAFNDDGTMIRANQGHSVEVDLQLPVAVAPDILYHGTAAHSLAIVLKEGLKRRQRHHVHLTADPQTAVAVGGRHGKPVLLHIDARAMQAAGYVFYVSANGVWLADEVPAAYIKAE